MSTLRNVLLAIRALIVLAVVASVMRRQFIKRARAGPVVVQMGQRPFKRDIDSVRRSPTVTVIDEVGDVLRGALHPQHRPRAA